MERVINILKWLVAIVAGAITSFFTPVATPLLLLLGFSTLDFLTALSAAENRGNQIESRKFWPGIKKKGYMILFVIYGLMVDLVIAYCVESVGFIMPLTQPVGIIVAIWLIINEAISVLENLKDILGEKAVPKWLDKLLAKVKSKIEDETNSIEQEGRNE